MNIWEQFLMWALGIVSVSYCFLVVWRLARHVEEGEPVPGVPERVFRSPYPGLSRVEAELKEKAK